MSTTLHPGDRRGARLPEAIRGFVVDDPPEPAYVSLLRSGELARRVDEAVASLESCRVCPRDCEVDRLHAVPPEGASRGAIDPRLARKRQVPAHIEKGTACFTGRWARVSTAYPHFGEEDVLRGWNGSGTVFFAFCNLRCVFCQNWDISQSGGGAELRPEELAGRMLDLQRQGCHNLNLVTPEHVVPQFLEALLLAAERGLRLPVVYNTSGYDSMESLRLLDGVVDIYMPDFKYLDAGLSKRYLKAADYPEVARRVVREMHRQVGPLRVERRGLAVRGVLVRHLVMPGGVADSAALFRWLADEVSPDTFVNVMDQFYPAGGDLEGRFPELNRRVRPEEMRRAFAAARDAGLWRFDIRFAHPRPRPA
ncbi:MAG: radical SAM protein [Myxococcota bacterium]